MINQSTAPLFLGPHPDSSLPERPAAEETPGFAPLLASALGEGGEELTARDARPEPEEEEERASELGAGANEAAMLSPRPGPPPRPTTAPAAPAPPLGEGAGGAGTADPEAPLEAVAARRASLSTRPLDALRFGTKTAGRAGAVGEARATAPGALPTAGRLAIDPGAALDEGRAPRAGAPTTTDELGAGAPPPRPVAPPTSLAETAVPGEAAGSALPAGPRPGEALPTPELMAPPAEAVDPATSARPVAGGGDHRDPASGTTRAAATRRAAETAGPQASTAPTGHRQALDGVEGAQPPIAPAAAADLGSPSLDLLAGHATPPSWPMGQEGQARDLTSGLPRTADPGTAPASRDGPEAAPLEWAPTAASPPGRAAGPGPTPAGDHSSSAAPIQLDWPTDHRAFVEAGGAQRGAAPSDAEGAPHSSPQPAAESERRARAAMTRRGALQDPGPATVPAAPASDSGAPPDELGSSTRAEAAPTPPEGAARPSAPRRPDPVAAEPTATSLPAGAAEQSAPELHQTLRAVRLAPGRNAGPSLASPATPEPEAAGGGPVVLPRPRSAAGALLPAATGAAAPVVSSPDATAGGLPLEAPGEPAPATAAAEPPLTVPLATAAETDQEPPGARPIALSGGDPAPAPLAAPGSTQPEASPPLIGGGASAPPPPRPAGEAESTRAARGAATLAQGPAPRDGAPPTAPEVRPAPTASPPTAGPADPADPEGTTGAQAPVVHRPAAGRERFDPPGLEATRPPFLNERHLAAPPSAPSAARAASAPALRPELPAEPDLGTAPTPSTSRGDLSAAEQPALPAEPGARRAVPVVRGSPSDAAPGRPSSSPASVQPPGTGQGRVEPESASSAAAAGEEPRPRATTTAAPHPARTPARAPGAAPRAPLDQPDGTGRSTGTPARRDPVPPRAAAPAPTSPRGTGVMGGTSPLPEEVAPLAARTAPAAPSAPLAPAHGAALEPEPSGDPILAPRAGAPLDPHPDPRATQASGAAPDLLTRADPRAAPDPRAAAGPSAPRATPPVAATGSTAPAEQTPSHPAVRGRPRRLPDEEQGEEARAAAFTWGPPPARTVERPEAPSPPAEGPAPPAPPALATVPAPAESAAARLVAFLAEQGGADAPMPDRSASPEPPETGPRPLAPAVERSSGSGAEERRPSSGDRGTDERHQRPAPLAHGPGPRGPLSVLPAPEIVLGEQPTPEGPASAREEKAPPVFDPAAPSLGPAAPAAERTHRPVAEEPPVVRALREVLPEQPAVYERRLSLVLPLPDGQVVRLLITPDAEVRHRVSLVAADPQVRRELERALPELRGLIAEVGLRGADISIEDGTRREARGWARHGSAEELRSNKDRRRT